MNREFSCRSLVVGTDGSANSALAVEWAAGLASLVGARVTLVHAVGLLDHLPGQAETVSIEIRDELQRLLEDAWSAPLRQRGVEHDCVMEDGPPLLAIPRVAERVRADLLVVASHGRGNATTLLLGSTSHGLAQTATVPVVILPRPAALDHGPAAPATPGTN